MSLAFITVCLTASCCDRSDSGYSGHKEGEREEGEEEGEEDVFSLPLYEETTFRGKNPNITFLDHGTYYCDEHGAWATEQNRIEHNRIEVSSESGHLLCFAVLLCGIMSVTGVAGFCRTAKRARPKPRPPDAIEHLTRQEHAVSHSPSCLPGLHTYLPAYLSSCPEKTMTAHFVLCFGLVRNAVCQVRNQTKRIEHRVQQQQQQPQGRHYQQQQSDNADDEWDAACEQTFAPAAAPPPPASSSAQRHGLARHSGRRDREGDDKRGTEDCSNSNSSKPRAEWNAVTKNEEHIRRQWAQREGLPKNR